MQQLEFLHFTPITESRKIVRTKTPNYRSIMSILVTTELRTRFFRTRKLDNYISSKRQVLHCSHTYAYTYTCLFFTTRISRHCVKFRLDFTYRASELSQINEDVALTTHHATPSVYLPRESPVTFTYSLAREHLLFSARGIICTLGPFLAISASLASTMDYHSVRLLYVGKEKKYV